MLYVHVLDEGAVPGCSCSQIIFSGSLDGLSGRRNLLSQEAMFPQLFQHTFQAALGYVHFASQIGEAVIPLALAAT